MWKIDLTKPAQKDSKIALQSKYKNKINKLLKIIKKNPFQNPPPYEKLQPPRANKYSRRINKQHRIVYEILEKELLIKVLSMWTHYE
jgi:Txe/YoeB family toxin of toxin-antitoxin system